MEFLKKKKKILYAGCVFFVIMFLCTLLSKGIYGASLPQVETEKPEKRALGHMVEAEGMVTANREVAVDTVSGLKVNQIYVNLGDSVSANTLLFDVDQEDLKEKISEQELAIKKLEMSNEQARQQKELDAQKERLAQNRSLEDYALADTEEDRKIEQAGDAVAKAEEKLDEHLNNQPRQTPDEERNQKKEEYKDWDSRMKDLQKQQISANSELEAAKAERRKALDDYIAPTVIPAAETVTADLTVRARITTADPAAPVAARTAMTVDRRRSGKIRRKAGKARHQAAV
ncbi:MAG: hypothetical protein ACLVAW_00005 [Eisenbergiella massiliensis]